MRTISRMHLGSVVVAALLACSTDNSDELLQARDLNMILGQIGLIQDNPDNDSNDGKEINVGDGVTAICTTKKWGASEVRELTEMALLGNNEGVYPGSLLRGSGLETGSFTTIGVPRAKGTIYLEGLTFDPGARYSRTVDAVTGSNVNQGIQDILSENNIVGTTSEIDTKIEQIYDFDDLSFHLGISTKFTLFKTGVSASGSIDITNNKTTNYYLARFRQNFYTITFDTPETPFDVFRDGEHFSDPAHQITKDDPVLYVSSAKYGRQFYLLIEAKHSQKDITAALNAVFGSKASETDEQKQKTKNGIAIDSKLTIKEVLDNSQISYVAMGGSAASAAKVLSKAGHADMFNALLALISAEENATYSRKNPGALLSYNLRYLKDNRVARMSFSAVYDRKDCEFKYPKQAGQRKYLLRLARLDDFVQFRINGQARAEWTWDRNKPGEGPGGHTWDISDALNPGANYLRIELSNLCEGSTLDMNLFVDGNVAQEFSYNGPYISVFDHRDCPVKLTPTNAWEYKIDTTADVVTPQ